MIPSLDPEEAAEVQKFQKIELSKKKASAAVRRAASLAAAKNK
jgi:hypothetical protein